MTIKDYKVIPKGNPNTLVTFFVIQRWSGRNWYVMDDIAFTIEEAEKLIEKYKSREVEFEKHLNQPIKEY